MRVTALTLSPSPTREGEPEHGARDSGSPSLLGGGRGRGRGERQPSQWTCYKIQTTMTRRCDRGLSASAAGRHPAEGHHYDERHATTTRPRGRQDGTSPRPPAASAGDCGHGCFSGGAWLDMRSISPADGRECLLYVPADYDVTQPAPLMLWLHGAGRAARGALAPLAPWPMRLV